MNINTLLLIYSTILTIILILLLPQTYKYRKWYLKLLIDYQSNFRIERFFREMNSIFKKFYPYLESLKNKRGRKSTDYCFQFRWLIWWKFFGSNVLQKALREYNESEFLKKLLNGPAYDYTRERFHYFRKKLSTGIIEKWGTDLIFELVNKKIFNLKTIIIDSFPIKSYLNTQKCLKSPKIDYIILKNLLESFQLDNVIKLINKSPKMYQKIKTKLSVLLIKEIWDLHTWNRVWKVLTGNEAKKFNITLPHQYKSVNSIRTIKKELNRVIEGRTIEEILLDQITPIIKNMANKASSFKLKSLNDLNYTWYTPHRARDPGISQYHCASKDENKFGRGGVILISKEFEMPLLTKITPKYKQGTESLLLFVQKVQDTYKSNLKSSHLLADSEFGIKDVKESIKSNITKYFSIPGYGHNENENTMPKIHRDTRKSVERVIGRLTTNWHLERPRHLGKDYASFHLQIIRLCDILQVIFNCKIGNHDHPHAFIPFRG